MLRNPACLEPRPENLFYPPRQGDYVYFESARPWESTALETHAAWAADAAMLAYARFGPDRMNEATFAAILRGAGYDRVDPIGDCFVPGATAARGFFAANDRHALLAFRGTEKDTAADVAADADLLLIDDARGARIHQGFQRYFQSVWWRVEQLLRDIPSDRPLLIAGHSLGAALATLAFRALPSRATSLYTFGCPRVGDRALCAAVESLAATRACYRIVDHEDVVTHVPLHTAGADFEHPNVTLLWIDAAGAVVRNPPNPPGDWTGVAHIAFGFFTGHFLEFLPNPLPRPLADHSPVRYCHWMSQAIRPEAEAARV